MEYERRVVGDGAVWLERRPEGLFLTDGAMELCADLGRMVPRLVPGKLGRELLVKAAKKRAAEVLPLAVDATAGFGEDGLLLAAAGYRVVLCEYDPVIAALLRDALERAAEVPELTEAVGRMTLVEGDSCEVLAGLSEVPAVVYLDPMFPERQKSALVKKKFQLLHHLESPCSAEEELLRAALTSGGRKIIIKRPLKGPYLAGRKPSYEIRGKAIRYDVVVQ